MLLWGEKMSQNIKKFVIVGEGNNVSCNGIVVAAKRDVLACLIHVYTTG